MLFCLFVFQDLLSKCKCLHDILEFDLEDQFFGQVYNRVLEIHSVLFAHPSFSDYLFSTFSYKCSLKYLGKKGLGLQQLKQCRNNLTVGG